MTEYIIESEYNCINRLNFLSWPTASAGTFSPWTQCDCPTSGPEKLWCPGILMTPLQSQRCSWWWVGGSTIIATVLSVLSSRPISVVSSANFRSLTEGYLDLQSFVYMEKIKLRWALFVTYTIIQSITSSEMCSLHLTHPSAHTPGAVGSRWGGPGSSWGFGALLKSLTSAVDNSSNCRNSNPQPRITSPTLH